jgi:putative ABC transport system ATP-binding protein
VARDVHKGFGPARDRTPIVRGVSLAVERGETVFLVGPSGSGKTTLLSLLGCILTPDRGNVEVLGRDVSALRPEQRAALRRDHLGFIFQNFNLFPTLSALDNVRMALTLRGVPRREALARAAELIGRVGLSHRARLRPPRLSTGECQRIAIARALAGDPAILLADEPTASLDAENGQLVMEMLAALARDRALTLLIVTHDSRIYHFADRILRLEDGRLADPRREAPVPGLDATPLDVVNWADLPHRGRKEIPA